VFMDKMRVWFCIVWNWSIEHWKSLGTLAGLGLAGRFVKWLVDIWKAKHEGEFAIEQTKEVKARNDERAKVAKNETAIRYYCEEMLKVKESGVTLLSVEQLYELVPLREPGDKELRKEAYGRLLNGKYRED
jgi:hypothetical protein